MADTEHQNAARAAFGGAFAGKRVLVTGHTGFKGSWLAMWLTQLGATVAGFSDGVPTSPSHFDAAHMQDRVTHFVGDIRDRAAVRRVVADWRPEVVFHLAAQALVRKSFDEPAATFETNTIGTLNICEVARTEPGIRAVVLVTSDKAYRNVEWVWGYRENDALGGDDPYSGSKGAAELVAHSYMSSFFANSPTAVATARAGNVIGGGDWAADRIVPDCMRAWSSGNVVTIRHPHATRPWQHVLEPLGGYLLLAARLLENDARARGESFNFGPDANVAAPVVELIERLSERWADTRWVVDPAALASRPEARLLKLSCDKALLDLSWHATLTLEETISFTADWYRAYYAGDADVWELTTGQIDRYTALARERQLAWASA